MTRPDPRRWAWLLMAFVGCAAQKPAPLPPDLSLQTLRAVGSPLARPVARDAFDARSAVGVKVTWLALPTFSDSGLIPLDAAASLTAAPLGEGALLSTGQVSREARFGSGMGAIRWITQLPPATTPVGRQSAFVSPGTTIRFDADQGQHSPSVSIAIYRDSAAALPTTVPATASATAPSTAPTAEGSFAISLGLSSRSGESNAGLETTFVNHQPLSPDTPYVLLLPPRPGEAFKSIAAVIEVLPVDADADEQAAWERQTRPSGPSTNPAPQPSKQVAVQRALEALSVEKDPRAALLYLSASTDAHITADVALVADGTLLGKMRDAVKTSDTTSPDSISWTLEKTTLLTLADAASKAPLPPEMLAVLAVHTGEVGRHPDLLAEIANAVGSGAALHERLIGENFIALEDNSASARVRAFDWLRSQGKAPADFDPLGPPGKRRAAINRAISSPGGTS